MTWFLKAKRSGSWEGSALCFGRLEKVRMQGFPGHLTGYSWPRTSRRVMLGILVKVPFVTGVVPFKL